MSPSDFAQIQYKKIVETNLDKEYLSAKEGKFERVSWLGLMISRLFGEGVSSFRAATVTKEIKEFVNNNYKYLSPDQLVEIKSKIEQLNVNYSKKNTTELPGMQEAINVCESHLPTQWPEAGVKKIEQATAALKTGAEKVAKKLEATTASQPQMKVAEKVQPKTASKGYDEAAFSKDFPHIPQFYKDRMKNLGEKVGYSNLRDVLQNKEEKEQQIILATFGQIDERLHSPKKDDESKLVRGEVSVFGRTFYDFAIEGDNIFIALPEKYEDKEKKAIYLNNPKVKASYETVPVLVDKKIHAKGTSKSKDNPEVVLNYGLRKSKGKPRTDAKALNDIATAKGSSIAPLNRGFSDGFRYLHFFTEDISHGDELVKARADKQLQALTGMARGLIQLHDHNFVHMNVSPKALRVTEGPGGEIEARLDKIGGSVKEDKPIKWQTKFYGARESQPHAFPMTAQKAHKEMDAFSFGLTILEIVNGSLEHPKEEYKNSYYAEFHQVKSQSTLDNIVAAAKEKINSDKSLNPDERQKKLGMLDVAKDLIKIDLESRGSLKDALTKLEALG